MSFDVHAMRFHEGETATGNAAAARAVLSAHPFDHEPDFAAYDVDLGDGRRVEMYADGLDGEGIDGAMFALRGLDEVTADFIFRFCHAAGFVCVAATDPPCALLTDLSQAEHVPDDLGSDAIPIADGRELLAALDGGYEAWRRYLEQTAGR